MNPEAEFHPRKGQSGSTAGASSNPSSNPSSGAASGPTPDSNTGPVPGNGSGSTADASGYGLDNTGPRLYSDAIRGHDSGNMPNHTANGPADTTLDFSSNAIHDPYHRYSHVPGSAAGCTTGPTPDPTSDPTANPPVGPEYDPSVAPGHYYSPDPVTGAPTGPEYGPIPGPTADYTACPTTTGPVYDPISGPAPGLYFNHNPGFDPRYAQAYPMTYNQHPQPMYPSSPMAYYNPYPTYPAYPTYPTYPPNPPPNPMPQYAYAAPPTYAPSPPVYAAPAPASPPPSPAPAPHYRAHVHTRKLAGTQKRSPTVSTTTRGEVGDPEAKIFVGDLPIGGTTPYLESCLRGLFLPFGPCWVNVSWGETAKKGNNVRNGVNQKEERVKKLPTGWIQFMEVTDAETVLATAKERGIYVGTRRLRIERADGKRIIRFWPKGVSSTVTAKDLHQEFRRYMKWLTSNGDRGLLFHISDCGEFIRKFNRVVLSVGVMFRWCEDAQYAAERFRFFSSNFQMRIEPVRTMAGLPSWRTSKLDWAARLDKLELDPGHKWRNNMRSMYLEAIDDIEAELKEEEETFDESSNNTQPLQLSDNCPRAPKINSSSSGKTSPSTLEDIEYEHEKKARKAKHWANIVLRKELPHALPSAEEASSSSSVQQHDDHCAESLNMALDAVGEEEEDQNAEDSENNFHLDSAVEDDEEVWEDDSDTVVAPSDSGVSETREETREETSKGNMSEH